MQEVLVGFKEQTEAEMDFVGYHALEQQYGTEFDFYRYSYAIQLIQQHQISNPSTTITGPELKSLLNPHRVNASQALGLHRQGISIGHTVQIFRGIK